MMEVIMKYIYVTNLLIYVYEWTSGEYCGDEKKFCAAAVVLLKRERGKKINGRPSQYTLNFFEVKEW